jgi:hypothetical protein
MFEDWSVDVDQDDDEPAGHVNRQEVIVPTQRHLDLYRLLRSNSHRDQAGRLVSWWTHQPKLAASLGVSVRTLRNLLTDLRQSGLDPRHPRGQPPGLRLGLVRVEATTYRDPATGRHRLGRSGGPGHPEAGLRPRHGAAAARGLQATATAGPHRWLPTAAEGARRRRLGRLPEQVAQPLPPPQALTGGERQGGPAVRTSTH